MNHLTKFLLIGTLFVGAANSAFASPITGTIDINGTAKTGGTGTITFTTNPAAATNGTGVFTTFNGPTEVKFAPTFSISAITPTTGELLFSMKNNYGYTIAFYVTNYTVSGSTYTFTGYLTLNGVNTAPGVLVDTFTSPDGNLGSEFSAQLTVTPEPNSIVLLGTGLFAACGMIAFRRRRESAATL
jgi:hypothetical protein